MKAGPTVAISVAVEKIKLGFLGPKVFINVYMVMVK